MPTHVPGPTGARSRLGRLARLPHRVRLEVWQLEDRVVPATAGFVEGPDGTLFPVPSEATSLPAGALGLPFLALAPQGEAPPVVRFNNPQTGIRMFPFVPFAPDFLGGVRPAAADVTGDGVPDFVVGVGPGGGSEVRVYDGASGAQAAGPLGSFQAFEAGFTGGVSVAAADVNRDGFADVIVAAGTGGGPRVRVLSGADGAVLADFFAADETLRFGLVVAAADVNRDGAADIITATGAGGVAEVTVFSGLDRSRLAGFLAFEPDFTLGVSLAAADVTGDGAADVLVGAGRGGSPRVRVFDGASGSVVKDFYAFESSFRGGANVAGIDTDGEGLAEIVTGAGPGGGSRVRVLDATTLAERISFAAYTAPFDNTGVVVAGR
ncbi:FG-GAP repeat domain-containing protein [Urbifossiella limnaea]|uniref:FG-GAP repeat protein n=1 Tax=Urbifossiella limnaea TaxID=2528023 RepID=A0A517XXB6_9BACT|nr:VCBS repeat-containing protein [Urbifossiella limnaea]QDU22157.1 FG-GAP repeat protein [Urbifossiella limnaea]